MTISDEKTKELLTEVIINLMKNKNDIFQEIMVEALEEVGMATAITQGRQDDFVSEEDIFSILDGENK